MWISWLKTAMVCAVTFFGGAFSIMTFNTDVDTSGCFSQLYRQFTGELFHRAYHSENLPVVGDRAWSCDFFQSLRAL